MTTDQALLILGLTENFTPQELKKAYRRMASTYHPDVQGTGDVVKFRQALEAHKILSSGKIIRSVLFTHQSIFTIVMK